VGISAACSLYGAKVNIHVHMIRQVSSSQVATAKFTVSGTACQTKCCTICEKHTELSCEKVTVKGRAILYLGNAAVYSQWFQLVVSVLYAVCVADVIYYSVARSIGNV
jgi:hypothetical protein